MLVISCCTGNEQRVASPDKDSGNSDAQEMSAPGGVGGRGGFAPEGTPPLTPQRGMPAVTGNLARGVAMTPAPSLNQQYVNVHS
jgi:hypothetical protein